MREGPFKSQKNFDTLFQNQKSISFQSICNDLSISKAELRQILKSVLDFILL